MTEGESRRAFGDQFALLQLAQEGLARRGYFLHAVEREHTEALVSGPLVHRLKTQIKKRGFSAVAGHVAITFSGYRHDPREVFAIPEVRAYWQQLDRELPELPALLTILPELRYNGPSLHLQLVGDIDAVIDHPALGGFELHVVNAEGLIAGASSRIRQAGQRYHLSQTAVSNLVDQFSRGARLRL